mgnify:CR=1 FL=1
MISECLKDINEPTNINDFYYQKSPNNQPSLLICNDRFLKQNVQQFNYILDTNSNHNNNDNNYNNRNNFNNVNNVNNRNNINKPIYIKNQVNSSELQKFYSENIDVESELKYINRFNDQCFYDNYKMDFKTNKGLSKHYDKIFKPQEQKINKMKDKKISGKKFIDENCVNWKNVKNFEECDVKKALPCPNINSSNLFLNSQNVFYQFHNDKYLDFYSCESLFNNFTKRN